MTLNPFALWYPLALLHTETLREYPAERIEVVREAVKILQRGGIYRSHLLSPERRTLRATAYSAAYMRQRYGTMPPGDGKLRNGRNLRLKAINQLLKVLDA